MIGGIISAIGGVAKTAMTEKAKDPSTYDNLSSGDSDLAEFRGFCQGTPLLSQIVAAISRAPLSEKDELARLIRRANQGAGPRDGGQLGQDQERWIQAAMGGKDCKAKSSKGRELKNYFLRFVQQHGMTPGPAATLPTSTATLPAQPIIINPEKGVPTVPTQEGLSFREYARRYGGALWGTAKETFVAGGTAALGTAQRAEAEAVKTRQGISAASFFGVPWMAIAALGIAFAVFVFARGRSK